MSPLSAISTSGKDATDMSVSVGPGTSMSVDLDDRDREITAAAMLELADTSPTTVGVGARRTTGNPSIVSSNSNNCCLLYFNANIMCSLKDFGSERRLRYRLFPA